MIDQTAMEYPFYSAPIVIWVEDSFTQTYLNTIWGNPSDIHVVRARSRTSVEVLTEEAISAGRERPPRLRHVFGLVDRDFSRTNYPWNRSDLRVFRTRRHEIENYALDAAVLEKCDFNQQPPKNEHAIQEQLRRLAAEQPAWLAYRSIVCRIQQDLTNGILGAGPMNEIQSPQQAIERIVTSKWFENLPAHSAHWQNETRIAQAIIDAHNQYAAQIDNGAWMIEFSGKEIFSGIQRFLYPGSRRGARQLTESDWAMAIGEAQISYKCIPDDLLELREILRARVSPRTR